MRLFKKKPIPELIPKAALSEIVAGRAEIRLAEPLFKTGNVTLSELVALNFVVKERNPSKVFEMGTFDGRTTLNIALNSSERTKIYTLDLPKEKLDATKFSVTSGDRDLIDKEASGSRFSKHPEARKIVQLYGDTATFDFKPYENQMDLVFIDASHAYEYVLNDTRRAFPLLKNSKGTILWHDYGSCGEVTQALNKLYLEEPRLKRARHIEGTSLVYLDL